MDNRLEMELLLSSHYVIRTKNGKYASIQYEEFFTYISESDTFIGNTPITVFETRVEASDEMIRLTLNEELIYFDDNVYFDQVVMISVNELIEEVWNDSI